MKVTFNTVKFNPVTSHNNTDYKRQISNENRISSNPYKSVPLNYKYNANISFGDFFDPNRTVPHIDYEEYMAMSESTRRRFRKKYADFYKDTSINKNELFDITEAYLPLKQSVISFLAHVSLGSISRFCLRMMMAVSHFLLSL